MSVVKGCKSQAIRLKYCTHAHTHAPRCCIPILPTVFPCVQRKYGTYYSAFSKAQVCVNAFSPLTLPFFFFFFSFFPPTLFPLASFSADSGLWQSYLPFDPDQSPFYLQLLNHKHFISSTLTLTVVRRCRVLVQSAFRCSVDAGLSPCPRMGWLGNVTLSNWASTQQTPLCTAVAPSRRETRTVATCTAAAVCWRVWRVRYIIHKNKCSSQRDTFNNLEPRCVSPLNVVDAI